MKQLLAILLLSASCVFGAVPSTTDFNTNYFTYGLLPMSLVGNLTNWSKLATNVISTNPGAGMSGTVSNNIASAGLLSVDSTKTNGIAATAAHIVSTLGFTPANSNNVPSGGDSFWTTNGSSTLVTTFPSGNIFQALTNTTGPFGDSTIFVLGLGNVDITTVGTGDFGELNLIGDYVIDPLGQPLNNFKASTAIGGSALYNTTINGGNLLTFFGEVSGSNSKWSNFTSSGGFGDDSFSLSNVTNSFFCWGFGSDSMSLTIITDSDNIGAFGPNSLYGITLANSHEVYSLGAYNAWPTFPSGSAFSGTLTNATMLGGRTHATNSNDFVTGNQWHNYFFPGASARFDNKVTGVSGFSSLATDSVVPLTSTGITNSLAKVGVARFDGTNVIYVVKNNAGTSVYTNSVAVGRVTEILQASGAIVVTSGTVIGTLAPF